MTPRSLLPLLLLLPALAAAQTAVAPQTQSPAFEWQADISYSGASDIAEGSRALGEIKHSAFQLESTRAFELGQDSAFLAGVTWRRFDFSGSIADVPDTLQAIALQLGYKRKLSPRWSLSAEIQPGLYSDFEDISGDDFNAPFGVRAIYARSREFQWLFGLNVDFRSHNPVMGGFGFRWQFAKDWTLLFLVPQPRIEYAVSPELTLFAGASLRGGTFRVAEDFGRRRGRATLDNQDVDFREISVGAGLRWQLQPGLTLSTSVGWMLDRRFEYEKRDLLINGKGAPTALLSISGSF
ncbi:MAG TPA: DUF6268 family outer membrane beta-barrel protein [Opitutaceae bacterium]